MKSLSYISVLLIILTIVSCKTMSNTTVTTDVNGPTVIQKPVVADLDVQETRVTGTAKAGRSTPEAEVKQLAVADALKKLNADVLIEPRYEVSTTLKETTVIVTGYPATYKNFRPMEAKDTIFIESNVLNSVGADRQKATKNGKTKKIVAWSIGGVLGAVGLFLLSFLFY